jgi:small basic protein
MITPPENKEPGNKEPRHQESLFDFIVENKWECLAYLVLFFGLLFSIFMPFIGGLIVGCILGIYFSAEAKDLFVRYKEFLEREGIFRSFVVVAAAIALLIAATGLVIGVCIGIFLRPLFPDSFHSPFE